MVNPSSSLLTLLVLNLFSLLSRGDEANVNIALHGAATNVDCLPGSEHWEQDASSSDLSPLTAWRLRRYASSATKPMHDVGQFATETCSNDATGCEHDDEVVLKWQRPTEKEVIGNEDQLGEARLEYLSGAKHLFQACLSPEEEQDRRHSLCSVVIQEGEFTIANQSCKVDCKGTDSNECLTRCPLFLKLERRTALSCSTGIRQFSAFIELAGKGGPQRLSPSKVTFFVGANPSSKFRNFLQQYAAIHLRSSSAQRFCKHTDGDDVWSSGECLRALIYKCGEYPCAGYTDRMRGIITTFLLALFTNRSFFIDYSDPIRLSQLLEPNEIDWDVDNHYLLQHRYSILDETEAVERRAIIMMEPNSTIPQQTVPLALDRAIAILALQTNWDVLSQATAGHPRWDLYPELCKAVPGFQAFAEDSGLLSLYPTPKPFAYNFLFAHSASFQEFYDEQLRKLPAPVQRQLSRPAGHECKGEGHWECGGDVVVAVQLRGSLSQWREQHLFLSAELEQHSAGVVGALRCAARLSRALGVRPRSAFVLVVTALPEIFRSAVQLAAEAGLDPERVCSVEPAVVAHIDKERGERAAASMPWVVLENVFMSRASAVVWTTGYGWVPAEYGGISPGLLAGMPGCL